MSNESPKDQFILLGSISNYHKYGYPSLKEEGGIIHVKNITYAEHVLYDDKFSKLDLMGKESECTYSLTKDRIMYFLEHVRSRTVPTGETHFERRPNK